jgi:glyoxylase-like metal-dependent hydrolase (beta-lactamase superfamily II)
MPVVFFIKQLWKQDITYDGCKGKMMKPVLVMCLLAILTSCAGPPASTRSGGSSAPLSRDQELVERAITAMGGADALLSLRGLSVRGTVKHWEPEQSHVPGGEMRFAADATFEATLDFVNHVSRIDWEKKFAYPAPRTFTYIEIVTPDAGAVIGIDSNGRTRESLANKPPMHAMSGLRLATTQRELRRSSPLLLLEMRSNPGRVYRMGDVGVDGVAYPALSYNAGAHSFIVLFDPRSGLPSRVRSHDFDNIWGDVNYDLVLTDWQMTGAVRMATSQRYELNGRTVADIRITHAAANPAINPAGMAVPAPLLKTAARPAVGNIPYQWVMRRQFIGTYLDSDNPGFDTQSTQSLRLQELAPGVQHVVGGSHNALVVDMRDHLIVFDAPVNDGQSNWTIRTAQARYGAKPVRYLVLTHHHMDHAGGLRAYLAQGATLVVGRGATAHYRRVLAAPATRNPDLAPRNYARVNIVEVPDRYVMSDGRREVSAHSTENPHVDAMLIGYVADARIGFVTDIWSPGAAPLPKEIDAPLAALVAAVRRAGIQPLRFAGGHGGTADYAPLAALAGAR